MGFSEGFGAQILASAGGIFADTYASHTRADPSFFCDFQ
jgi:hypothetical protein